MLTFKEFLLEKVTVAYKDISFEYHDELHPDFWENEKLRPEIRKQLLKIADNFLDVFEDFTPVILDKTFTGSLANYNWGPKSDLDIHIIFDSNADYGGSKIVPETFMKAKLKDWSKDHKNVKIKGFPIEVSVQMSGETHESTGVYSLIKNAWIKKPKEEKELNLDHDAVLKRTKELEKQIGEMMKKNISPAKIEAFKDHIRKARKKGLKKEGELSIDNLAFKALRKAGLLDRLWQHAKDVDNKELSLS